MSVLTYMKKRQQKKTPFTSGNIVSTSLHGNKQPQHRITNNTFPFPTVLASVLSTSYIEDMFKLGSKTVTVAIVTDHYVLHVN